MNNRSSQGFTVIQLVVVLVLLVVGVSIVLPILSHQGCRIPIELQNNTQIRGIHSSLLLYSQDNNSYFPGRYSDGTLAEDFTVEKRIKLLIDDNYFTSEYAICIKDKKTPWESGPFTSDNYSYALLNLSDAQSPRMTEWRDTGNSKAVVISDRAVKDRKTGQLKSIHNIRRSDYYPMPWRGSVGFNDNHVEFTFADKPPLTTKYGDDTFENDNLFDTIGASMVCEGVDQIVESN